MKIELNLLKENVCLSGGAPGADISWGNSAKKAGHQVIHWTFENSSHALKEDFCCLTQEQLNQADLYLQRANKSIKRTWPTQSLISNNYLRRDFFQTRWAQSVYAVSTFDNSNSLLKIAGGTAWACQCYVDRFMYDQEPKENMWLYFFDQNTNCWYKWMPTWQKITKPPRPSNVYAGIGTRNISKQALEALQTVFE